MKGPPPRPDGGARSPKSAALASAPFLVGLLIVLWSAPGRTQAPAAGGSEAAVSDAKGRVSTPEKEPLEGIAVEISVEPNRQVVGKGVTDSDGVFRIKGVPASGVVTIRVSGKDCYTLVKKNVPVEDLRKTAPYPLTIQCCARE
jgi:hypothetical protein